MTDSIILYLSILWPALLAGLIVLSTHVPLGQEVLKRGIIFLDLAIAQTAALGLIIANLLGIHAEDQPLLQQVIAITAAIGGAVLLYQFRDLPARIQEALIGILFALAATGSVLLLSKDPHGGERLKELLVGQILWIKATDLIAIAIAYIAILSTWFVLKPRLSKTISEWIFYPLFAITITLSTQLVGVYLVFASLIIPALTTLQQTRPLLKAYCFGFIAYAGGLLLSAIFDFPSGAMVVWCMAGIGVAFWIVTKGNNQYRNL